MFLLAKNVWNIVFYGPQGWSRKTARPGMLAVEVLLPPQSRLPKTAMNLSLSGEPCYGNN
jgi:hypothetical protein